MTLSSALSSALSGLGVTARRAEIVSTNIANTETQGYARRSLTVVPPAWSPGVRAIGTERHVDTVILGEARTASANAAGHDLMARQLARLETALGKSGEGTGIPASITRLDAAFVAAAANPASDAALAEVADAVAALAREFARASSAIQTIRAESDRQVASDVERLDAGLSRIATLDRQITALRAAGRDVSSLLDQRQAQIDALSRILPLREVTREDGQTMIVTATGTILLDKRAATIDFEPTRAIAADRQDPLAPVLLDGRPVNSGAAGPLSGGTLSAAIKLRDEVTTGLQAALDQLALDISGRLAAADTTLATGDPGLLTDEGAAADALRLPGLAARLELNPAADFDGSGDLWRIRSGLGAATPLPAGDGTRLRALQASLDGMADRPATAAATMVETLTLRRVKSEDEATVSRNAEQTLQRQYAEGGVNTDQELQDLMQIERAYAANARVMQAVDEMLQTLLAR